MTKIVLKEPTASDEAAVWAYRQEFLNADDSMDGTSYLAQMTDYAAWLAHLSLYTSSETVPAGHVPGIVWLAFLDERLVGIINLRYELSSYLANYGGHIGYSIRPSERKCGYGTQLLAAVLPLARQAGLDRVLVTCNDTNIGSQKIIEKNGDILEDKRLDPHDQRLTRRYWIAL